MFDLSPGSHGGSGQHPRRSFFLPARAGRAQTRPEEMSCTEAEARTAGYGAADATRTLLLDMQGA